MEIVLFQDNWVGGWVMPRAGGHWFPGRGICIGLKDSDGNLVAGMVFEAYSGTNLFAHCAIREGSSITEEFLHVCFHYCFIENNCRRITSMVDDSNTRCKRFVGRLGATEECRLTGAGLNGGDLVIFKMLKEDCKFLTEDERNGIVR